MWIETHRKESILRDKVCGWRRGCGASAGEWTRRRPGERRGRGRRIALSHCLDQIHPVALIPRRLPRREPAERTQYPQNFKKKDTNYQDSIVFDRGGA